MKAKHILGILVMAVLALASCQNVNLPEAGNKDLATVSNLAYKTAGRELTLTWDLPVQNTANPMVGIQVIKNNIESVLIDSLATSYVVKRAAVNTELTYSVRIKYQDGRMSQGQSIIFTIAYEEKARPAFVLLADDVEGLQSVSAEEYGAAKWFEENYVNTGEGNFIAAADLASGINMGEVSMLWIHVDRVGLEAGVNNLPAELVSNGAKTALRSYIQNGGNIYLSKHATQLVEAYGRVKAAYAPNIFGSPDGEVGTDVWAINANLVNGTYDKRNHPFFSGMTANTDANGTYPLVGPVYRTDHNCMWNLNQLTFTKDGADNFDKFQKQTNSEIIATWGHVVDDAVSGLIIFLDDDDNFLGKVVCNGLAAYNMGNEENTEYAANNQILTTNIINYLK